MLNDKTLSNLPVISSDGDDNHRNKRIKLSDSSMHPKLEDLALSNTPHSIMIGHHELSQGTNPHSILVQSETREECTISHIHDCGDSINPMTQEIIDDVSIGMESIATAITKKKRKQSLDSDFSINEANIRSENSKRIRCHPEFQSSITDVPTMSELEQLSIEPQIKIYCNSLLGSLPIEYISMEMDDTIEDLKLSIYACFNIHPIHQVLLHQGKPIAQDSVKLLDAGLRDGSKIQILVTMKGGPLGPNDDEESEILSVESTEQMIFDSSMQNDTNSLAQIIDSPEEVSLFRPIEQSSINDGIGTDDERKKCSKCCKKLRISTGFRCKCDLYFCLEHRYAELHNCSFDYRAYGKFLLTRENPVIRKNLLL